MGTLSKIAERAGKFAAKHPAGVGLAAYAAANTVETRRNTETGGFRESVSHAWELTKGLAVEIWGAGKSYFAAKTTEEVWHDVKSGAGDVADGISTQYINMPNDSSKLPIQTLPASDDAAQGVMMMDDSGFGAYEPPSPELTIGAGKALYKNFVPRILEAASHLPLVGRWFHRASQWSPNMTPKSQMELAGMESGNWAATAVQIAPLGRGLKAIQIAGRIVDTGDVVNIVTDYFTAPNTGTDTTPAKPTSAPSAPLVAATPSQPNYCGMLRVDRTVCEPSDGQSPPVATSGTLKVVSQATPQPKVTRVSSMNMNGA